MNPFESLAMNLIMNAQLAVKVHSERFLEGKVAGSKVIFIKEKTATQNQAEIGPTGQNI